VQIFRFSLLNRFYRSSSVAPSFIDRLLFVVIVASFVRAQKSGTNERSFHNRSGFGPHSLSIRSLRYSIVRPTFRNRWLW